MSTRSEFDISPSSGLLASGILCGLLAGLLTAVAFLSLNPVFLSGSVIAFLLYLVLLPATVGLATGALFALSGVLVCRWASGPGQPATIRSGVSLMFVTALLPPAVPLGFGFPVTGGAAGSLCLAAGLLLTAGVLVAARVLRPPDSVRAPVRFTVRRVAAVTAAGLVLLLVTWGVSATFRAPPATLGDDGPELVVVGLDGASPRIIEAMTGRGELPAFRRVMDSGCFGELTSLEPIFSPTIWASITTGKRPEKHGIRDFLNASYLDIHGKTLWEILADNGRRVGLYEWLCTWPPARIDGFVVPGWLARNSLTWPESLRFIKEIKTSGRSGVERKSLLALGADLVQAVRHGLRLSSLAGLGELFVFDVVDRPGRTAIHYRKYLAALAMDVDIFDHLLMNQRPDCVFYYHQTIDPISHVYWEYYEPQGFDTTPREVDLYGGVVEEAYRAMDRALGRLLRRLDPQTPLIIVSDHGFQSILQQPGSSGLLISIRADVLLETLGLDGLEGFHTMNNVFITAGTGDPDRAGRLLGEAVERVSEYWIPDVGKPLFVAQLIDNPGADADYVRVLLNENLTGDYHAGRLSEEETVVRYPGGQSMAGRFISMKYHSGIHHLEGLILARGAGIRRGVRLPRDACSVLDVTPTLLALLGLPVARDMDGRVLDELFDSASGMAAPGWVETYGGGEEKLPIVGQGAEEGLDEALRRRLRSLGYMD